jgi:tetratricopeptide (TPR) repeat protein
LHRYALALENANRLPEACDAAEKELACIRQHTNRSPAHREDLLHSISLVARLIAGRGETKRAEKLCAEARKLLDATDSRTLFVLKRWLPRWREWRQYVLHLYGSAMIDLKRETEAIAAIEKAISLVGERSLARPGLHYSLGQALQHAGRFDDARQSFEQAVLLLRTSALPEASEKLPESLYDYGLSLGSCKRYKDAVLAFQESTPLFNQLLRSHPAYYYPLLTNSTFEYGKQLFNIGDHHEVCKVLKDALRLEGEFSRDSREASLSLQAESLYLLSCSYHRCKKFDEARESIREAIPLQREVVGLSDNRVRRQHLAKYLWIQARILRAQHRAEEALEPITEAIAYQQTLLEAVLASPSSPSYPVLLRQFLLLYKVQHAIILFDVGEIVGSQVLVETCLETLGDLNESEPIRYGEAKAVLLYSYARCHMARKEYEKAGQLLQSAENLPAWQRTFFHVNPSEIAEMLQKCLKKTR